ncbi:MAG: hypothetical protein M3Y59_25895 [Myxococcota bacterium]|nr:hypothetical protein [Myxococcota bacterium]
MSGANRINQTPVRISTNISVERQTAKSDFGDRIQAGLSQAAGVLANGAAMAAPFIPGGAVVSAAVSSLNTMGQQMTAGSSAYAATGVTSLNTTVGGAGTSVAGGGVGGIGNSLPGAGGVGAGSTGSMNVGMSDSASELGKMLQVQMQVQKENQVFTTVSNVLKTRHDTVKNTISNVR